MKSSKTILSLPGEIVHNILSRLPAKCLGQCKCVCKPLNSSISEKNFHKLHLNRALLDTDHSRILTISPFYSLNFESQYAYEDFTDDDGNKALLELDFPSIQRPDFDPDVFGSVEFVGSCNGLLCLCITPNSFIVWNPTTGEFRDIPDSARSSDDQDFTFYGFGYDPSSDDYKLVTCVSEKNSKIIEICCLKNCSWARVEHELDGDSNSNNDTPGVGTHLNGALHWEETRGNVPNARKIFIFLNLAGEKYESGDILGPSCANEDISFHDFGVTKGCLSLLSDEKSDKIGIWIMKEYGVRESWAKIVILDLNDFTYFGYVTPVCIGKNDDVIIDIDGEILVKYNLMEKSSRSLKNGSAPNLVYPIYVESLISPNSL